jgi:hypothetical protein
MSDVGVWRESGMKLHVVVLHGCGCGCGCGCATELEAPQAGCHSVELS